MQHHLALLGWEVKDKVTGFTGTVSTIGFDLYGCVQAIVTPKAVIEKEGGAQKLDPSQWFDVSRLEKIGAHPVMQPIPLKGDLTVAGADNRKPVR
ncbi:MAG: hypothetical protein QHD01_31625 [Bradyrhizobium sp.]|uniref:hypothetical protein n=1 Tax=Bradyrhizobium sp. TaxID=376 RepID=UPI0029A57B41|nr:hypothetical protein [Bradyrhizobium sp.]MDX3971119.1 hypothetical protein [Bradyrhizobium sp.]